MCRYTFCSHLVHFVYFSKITSDIASKICVYILRLKMASPADGGDGEILVRNIHLGSSDVHQLPADPVYVVYKRRWYILAVVSVLNVSNAMVRTQV